MTRRTLVLPLLAIAALAAGCGIGIGPEWPSLPNPTPTIPAFKADLPSQQDVIGDVRVTTEICLGAHSGGTKEPALLTRGKSAKCEDQREAALALIDGRGASAGALPSLETRRARRAAPTHADVAKAGFSDISLGQLLISYRVPEGATAPDEIAGAVDDDDAFTDQLSDRATCIYAQMKVTSRTECDMLPPGTPRQEVEFTDSIGFTRDDGLGAEMEALEPAPDGEKWVGYVSEQVPWALTGLLTVEADFGLPVPEDGAPFAGPFEHETRMGVRSALTPRDVEAQELLHDAAMWLRETIDGDPCEIIGPELPGCGGEGPPCAIVPGGCIGIESAVRRGDDAPAPVTKTVADYDPGRAVDCAEALPPVDLVDERDETPGRVTAPPSPSTFCSLEAPAGVVDDLSLPTRDLRVRGGEATAEQGATAAVPFTLTYAGPAAGTALDLAGDTALPFSSATTLATWTPAANERRTETVTVAVPDDARPGVYDVTLQVGSGEEVREAVGRLIVTARTRPEQVRTITEQVASVTAMTVERLFVGRDGSVAFGFVCPAELAAACERGVAEVLASSSELKRASAAAAGPAKMTRLGSKRFKGKAGKRVRVKVRLGRTGRQATAKGRRIEARLVLRVGKYKQVRRISLRRG